MAEYYDGQITLMGVNDKATHVTFNATLREGYTRTMLADTIAHYCAFMVAVRDGVRQLDKQWGGLRPDYEYSGALMAHDYLINLWGGSKSGSVNYFTEPTTAQSALDFYWQCKDDLAAIDMARVLEVANEGEKEATLDPRDAMLKRNVQDVLPLRDEWNGTYPVLETPERIITRPPSARLDGPGWSKRVIKNAGGDY